jgi:hypothetical protein
VTWFRHRPREDDEAVEEGEDLGLLKLLAKARALQLRWDGQGPGSLRALDGVTTSKQALHGIGYDHRLVLRHARFGVPPA